MSITSCLHCGFILPKSLHIVFWIPKASSQWEAPLLFSLSLLCGSQWIITPWLSPPREVHLRDNNSSAQQLASCVWPSQFILHSFDPDSSLHPQDVIRLEQDIFAQQLAGSGKLYVYHTNNFWSQIKSAGWATLTLALNQPCTAALGMSVLFAGLPFMLTDIIWTSTGELTPTGWPPPVTDPPSLTMSSSTLQRLSIHLPL